MKTQKFKILALVSLLSLLLMPLARAQDEVTKEFHESYSADNSTKLVIENMYGNIDIKDWDQNQVKIDVIVKVKHSNGEKADKILSFIDVVISESGNEIKAVTNFDDKFRNLRNDNSEISVDYSVQMPAEISIDISNKYGNVFISEVTGHAVVTVKYGNLQANRIMRGKEKPLSEVNLKYTDAASIEEADWLKVNMKYAHLNIDKVKALVLVSGYSEVSVDEASSIVSEAAYDEYRFGSLDNFVTTMKYSNVKIEEVADELNCETKYSDFKVGYMPAGFESVKINNEYGSFKIGIDEGASYKLDGEASYAKISYHETGKVSRISENNSMTVSGTVGNDSNTKSFVKVITKYGSVQLDD
ncbi:MAG: hypothetical protein ISS19_13555 [Bacteroidales bacterium]|nr:hypothetical protein [Bacteroidales bacterium]